VVRHIVDSNVRCCGFPVYIQTHEKAAVTTQQDWRTQRTKHHTVCNNSITQETNPTEPQLKTKQHKTNIEVKKRFIRVTQIICSNYKVYIMTYL